MVVNFNCLGLLCINKEEQDWLRKLVDDFFKARKQKKEDEKSNRKNKKRI